MAIAYDTSTKSSGKTFTHTCTGSNIVLIVYTNTSSVHATAVTYNGVSLTNIISQIGNDYMDVWILVNPSTGTNNIVITSTSSLDLYYGLSYSGCYQISQPDSSGTTNGSMNSGLLVSTTVVSTNCWLVGFSNSTYTITTNATNRQNGTSGQYNYSSVICDTNNTVGTGSQGITFTSTPGIGRGIVLSLSPAPDANGDFFEFF